MTKTGPLTIVLAAHGGENLARGGPTTRIAAIAAACEKAGHRVLCVADIQALDEGSAPDIIHVFNSWPVSSAIQQLRLARDRGAIAVFSPIALNLNYLPHFQQGLPSLLEQAVDESQMRAAAAAMRAAAPPWRPSQEAAPPAEGSPGQFQGLRAAAALADHTIYLSDREKAFLEAIGAGARSAFLVRNGVDASPPSPGAGERFKAAFGFSNFVLHVGRIEARKNLALAAAAARSADAPLVSIGGVAEPAYLDLVKRWTPPNFLHVDRIEDRALLFDAYAAASLFCLPSWSEGAPLAALEAGAVGAPLILSNMSGETEYFEDHARYRHPCDLDGLARDIRDALDKPETPDQRAARSAFILKRYNIDQHTAETLEIYEDLAARPRTSHTRPPAIAQLASGRDGERLRRLAEAVAQAAGASARIEPLQTSAPAALFPALGFRPVTDIVLTSVAAHLAPSIHMRGGEALTATLKRLGPKRSLVSLFKQAVNALPPPLHWTVKRILTKVSPQTTLIVSDEHRVFQSRAALNGVRVDIEAAAQTRWTRHGDGATLAAVFIIAEAGAIDEAFACELKQLRETSAAPLALVVLNADGDSASTRPQTLVEALGDMEDVSGLQDQPKGLATAVIRNSLSDICVFTVERAVEPSRRLAEFILSIAIDDREVLQ